MAYLTLSWKAMLRFRRRALQRYAFFGVTLLGVAFAAGVFLLEPSLVGLISRRSFLEHTEQVRQYARDQQAFLLENAREIARSGMLIQAIRDEDASRVALVAHTEGVRRGISAILVSDSMGVAISRSYAASQRGDYTFQLGPWGEALSRGVEVTAIDRGVAHPLLMFAGAPVLDNGVQIGSVIAAFPLYDDYAKAFRSRYLGSSGQVAFYRQGVGLVGTSFSDPGDRSAIAAYLSSGDDFTECCGDPQLLKIKDDVYLVGNVVFEGVKMPAGGMLILHPVQSRGQRSSLVLGMTVVLLAALSCLTWRRRQTLLEVRWTLFLCAVFFFLTIQALLSVFVARQEFVRVIDAPDMPSIYNSTLYFDPESAVFELNSEHSVAIHVATGGERVNAVRAVVGFDPARIIVSRVESENSLCQDGIMLENTIDNKNGIVTVSCGLLGAELSGTSVLARLVFQPIVVGDISLHFSEGTRVLANDGLGTSVLRSWTDGGYTVVAEHLDGAHAPAPLIVFSPTHANRERWYSTRSMVVSWLPRPGDSYSYLLDDGAEVSVASGASSFELAHLSDGVHTVRLSAWSGGVRTETAELHAKIDGTSPEGPVIRLSDTSIIAGDVVRVDASGGGDEVSGLQKGMYVQVDNGVFLPAKLPLSIPFVRRGVHRVTVRIFDNAGNHADSSIEVHVRSRSGFIDRFLNELLPTISGYVASIL